MFLELSGSRDNGSLYTALIDVFFVRAVTSSEREGYSNVYLGNDVIRVLGLASVVCGKIDEHRAAVRKSRVMRTGSL